ncbi:MAG: purine-nucleoside phosphorylase [Rhizobiales bacterium]|nr:purine-nucleoside phosphorylase [Hyphomicrobiales bacterium]OJU30548.1 MAG: purine-nucleoside phosphorylase [Rhizobiales bacterium 68-8]
MDASLRNRIDAAVQSIRGFTGAAPELGIVLGSGLGFLADEVGQAVEIPYGAIGGFPQSTAPGHAGRLIVGSLFGRTAALMQGRFHLYEGHSPANVALPIYVLAALGMRELVVTNAAGGLNGDFDAGDVMMITDHMNFTGSNPLIGPNEESMGPRFPDMSRAYAPDLARRAHEAARRASVDLRAGIYAAVAGPALETSAERRFFRMAGADAIGMSTVHEVIAAAHLGIPVLGLSAITNKATGGPDQQPDTIEEVLENAGIAGAKIGRILAALFQKAGA